MASTNMNKRSSVTPFAGNRILDLAKRQQQQQPQQQNDDSTSAPEKKKAIRMLPCSPAHVPAMVDVYLSAFGGSTFAHWWPENREVMRPWSERRFTNRFKDERGVQFLAVADDGDGHGDKEVAVEDVVAYAKWTLPKPGKSGIGAEEDQYMMLRKAFGLPVPAGGGVEGDPAKTTTVVKDEDAEAQNVKEKEHHGDLPTALPEGANAEWHREFFDGMAQLYEKYSTDDLLELTHMCTRRSAHGQGIAGAMIRSVLEEVVDPLGVKTMLLGIDLAVPLYRRLGFVTVEEVTFKKMREEAGMIGVLHVMIREPQVAVAQNGT